MPDLLMPSRDLRLLFVASRWEYGDPNRGSSHEYVNMFDSLVHMDGVEVYFYDFVSAYQRGGHERVRSELLGAVASVKPDVMLSMLYRDEISAEVLAELRDRSDVTTVNWFSDDHWRFDGFTKHYAPLFNFATTTTRTAVPRYREIGYDHVIKTQWACNPHLFHPTGGRMRFDTTFVGQVYGSRPWTVQKLRDAGVDARAWGFGWPDGVLTIEEMVAVFAESRVNLNLTNAYVDPRIPRLVRRAVDKLYPPVLERLPGGAINQIKARTFEIPACGGFQLSGPCDDIESYFEPGEEIVIFRTQRELVEHTRRYLRDEALRNEIAEAGYRRAIAEHTWKHRFRAIFDAIGVR